MSEVTAKRRKHVHVKHASWCRDGIIFRHEVERPTVRRGITLATLTTEIHTWCIRCNGEACPTCHPNAYAPKSKKALSGYSDPPWSSVTEKGRLGPRPEPDCEGCGEKVRNCTCGDEDAANPPEPPT